MFDLFNLLKRVASFELREDVCPASAPCAGSLPAPLGPPSLQSNPHGKQKEGYTIPCHVTHNFCDFLECITVCISSWAQLYFYPVPVVGITNIAQAHGSANPTLSRAKLANHLYPC